MYTVFCTFSKTLLTIKLEIFVDFLSVLFIILYTPTEKYNHGTNINVFRLGLQSSEN